MSRAFVKESDDAREELPELQVSPHRNFVTAEGLKQIESSVDRLRDYLSRAREAGDSAGVARIQRDLRYWVERLRTAEVVVPPAANGIVRFASTVVLEGTGGKRVEFRIVGEDEADPANGRISYVSPIGRALIGSGIGDEATLAGGPAAIVAIR
jgi:transcription elongation GreA/GreB family factor